MHRRSNAAGVGPRAVNAGAEAERTARLITSRHNVHVRQYRALAGDRPPKRSQVLLDGVHLIEEARAAGVRLVSAAFAAADDRSETLSRLAHTLQRDGIEVLDVSASVMEAMSPVRTPSGVVAIAEYDPPALDRVFDRSPQLVVIAVDIQDPGNVGALIRACEAGGATGLIAAGASADPLSWKALRGSMGSAFRLPVVSRVSVATAVNAARQRALRVLAAGPRGGQDLFSVDLTGPIALLLGSEGGGLSSDVLDLAAEVVTIPMRSPVESLNVAVAGSLFVYEAFRQRAAGDPKSGT